MHLLKFDRPVETIFHLLGDGENHMTAGLGLVLSRSPILLRTLLRDVLGESLDVAEATIRLQSATDTRGITDIEIHVPPKACVVIEAKQGAGLPSVAQLRRYAPVVRRADGPLKTLVALTNATPEYAQMVLPTAVDGVPVVHRLWRQVKDLAARSRGAETNATKRLVNEFIKYVGGLIGMETRFSNLVYVVSLGGGTPEGWSISWIDIVEKRKRYFYPVGGGWPEPPNYIGFRYDGRLQSIHHIEAYEIFSNPRTIFPEARKKEWGPHYCFRLGPPIRPAREVKNGPRIHRNAKCWCMLDTLLTSATISDALTRTKRRQRDG